MVRANAVVGVEDTLVLVLVLVVVGLEDDTLVVDDVEVVGGARQLERIRK